MKDAVVTIALSDVLWIAGFIATVAGAWIIIKKIPFFSHEQRLKKLEETPLHTHEKRIQRLEEIAEDNAELVTLIGKGVKCLLTNARTGDCIDKIQKAEEEMEKFLFDNRGV